jgi:lysophospholipid acyltransferase (LPLAT)-like uncharacterized protein
MRKLMPEATNPFAIADKDARRAEVKLPQNPHRFTWWQRVEIAVAAWVGYLAVRVIGLTLRWRVEGWENWEAANRAGKGIVYTFWHREIFAATWFWRNRGIVVMSGRNFDAEYVARIVQRHGYGVSRGSSSRGAAGALAGMARALRAGRDAAFTIDGPSGPRFVAKRGSVLLAKASGAVVLCFHIAVTKAYVFRKSWDLTQIPYPFSRAAIFIAPPIDVPAGATPEELDRKQQEVQATLDHLRQRGEAMNG